LHGRLLRPEDFQLGSSPVVILSYGVWQRRFGEAASLIGRSLTLDVPLLAGRLLNTFDRADGEAVTVINQTMRERFWPDEDPIGKYIRVVGSQTPIAIVGVVGAVLHGSLERSAA